MICAASSGIGTMDIESTDFNNEFRRMEGKLNYYKAKLRSCREKYDSVEMNIHDMRKRLQKGLFILDNAEQSEEENLHERLRDIHLSHDACAKKSDSQKNLNEMIRANIGELTLRRNTLMEELMQLRRNADDNDRKLARVNAMITEQEIINSIHYKSHRSTNAWNQ
jgi:chromosome segregation ATPase